MTTANWWIRRLAVRCFGQGPRTGAGLAEIGTNLRLLQRETGTIFRTLPPRLIDADTPPEVATWPLESSCEPDRCSYALRHAGLYDGDGVIYERTSRRAIRETLDYWRLPPGRHPALGRPRMSPPKILPDTSLFIGGLGGRTFFHFLIETLPQLSVLAREIASVQRIIVQGYLEPVKEAWLHQAGVRRPIVWLQPLDHFLCDELVFCTRVVTHYQPNPWALAALRNLVGARDRPIRGRRRLVWAERRQSHVRSIAWENDLIRQLPPPWEAVDFASLSPAQTLELCSECVAFAGFHGAALANLALCPPGVRVCEFYQEPKESWYPALSVAAGHEHSVAPAAIGPGRILQCLRDESRRPCHS